MQISLIFFFYFSFVFSFVLQKNTAFSFQVALECAHSGEDRLGGNRRRIELADEKTWVRILALPLSSSGILCISLAFLWTQALPCLK